jgi:hypothetical protein
LFKGNVIADNLNVSGSGYPINNKFPVGNFFVRSYHDVGFVDYARGDWRLSQQSKFKGKATDGLDPGVDFAALAKAVASSDVNAPYFGAKGQ